MNTIQLTSYQNLAQFELNQCPSPGKHTHKTPPQTRTRSITGAAADFSDTFRKRTSPFRFFRELGLNPSRRQRTISLDDPPPSIDPVDIPRSSSSPPPKTSSPSFNDPSPKRHLDPQAGDDEEMGEVKTEAIVNNPRITHYPRISSVEDEANILHMQIQSFSLHHSDMQETNSAKNAHFVEQTRPSVTWGDSPKKSFSTSHFANSSFSSYINSSLPQINASPGNNFNQKNGSNGQIQIPPSLELLRNLSHSSENIGDLKKQQTKAKPSYLRRNHLSLPSISPPLLSPSSSPTSPSSPLPSSSVHSSLMPSLLPSSLSSLDNSMSIDTPTLPPTPSSLPLKIVPVALVAPKPQPIYLLTPVPPSDHLPARNPPLSISPLPVIPAAPPVYFSPRKKKRESDYSTSVGISVSVLSSLIESDDYDKDIEFELEDFENSHFQRDINDVVRLSTSRCRAPDAVQMIQGSFNIPLEPTRTGVSSGPINQTQIVSPRANRPVAPMTGQSTNSFEFQQAVNGGSYHFL